MWRPSLGLRWQHAALRPQLAPSRHGSTCAPRRGPPGRIHLAVWTATGSACAGLVLYRQLHYTPPIRADRPSANRSSSATGDVWSSIGQSVSGALIPAWAESLPQHLAKFQREMELTSGTLASEIWKEAHDPSIHPEIKRDAVVRVSDHLCDEEVAFLRKRKQFTRRGLAKYLDLGSEEDVHPDDVPVIAMCGSGGGLRALVAGASSYYSTQEAGLFDCVTYTSGVSGSCWLLALYHSSLSKQSFQRLLDHLKARIHTHIAFPPTVLKLLTSAPTDKYLLSGAIEKYHGLPDAAWGLVDAYSIMIAARLLVPKDELNVRPEDLKISSQRKNVDSGEHPLPIYTAVRHEIAASDPKDQYGVQGLAAQQKSEEESWFQWFEFTPYELFCEEIGAGIPTWATGRTFEGGRTQWRESGVVLPELRTTTLLGIFGSAFCATLSHYYKEVRPLVLGLSGMTGFDELVSSRDEDLAKIHPIDPAQIPNFVYGMRDQLPQRCPESLLQSKDIELMDAGMSNNLPIYPLLRPGRDVDIIIAFDASADIQRDNWLKVADGYARQRGIKGWPIGVGWPSEDQASPKDVDKALDEAESMNSQQTSKQVEMAQRQDPGSKYPLKQGTVWVGSTQERSSDKEPPPSKIVEEGWELMEPDAGITIVYFPLVENPRFKGLDPQTTDFMSTWNFIYTRDNVDSVVKVAKANFLDGQERTKMAVRAVYERKKKQRLEREKKHPNQNRWQLPEEAASSSGSRK